jgi:uncharacterized membrane protein
MDSKHTIELIATAFEVVGVGVLVLGSIIAVVHYVVTLIRSRKNHVAYRDLRLDLGRAILVALELLIVADIIRSVAIDPTFASVGVLGLIVLVRTFLSWSLEVEIDGVWPWDRAKLQKGQPADPNEL